MMTVEANKAVVRRFLAVVWNAGNLSVADELVHPDYEILGVGRGPEAVKHNVRAFRTAFPDLVGTIDDMVAEDDRVAARLTLRGTHLGPFREIGPTGKSIVMEEMAFWRLVDGKLHTGWFQADGLGLRRQLGVLPASDRALGEINAQKRLARRYYDEVFGQHRLETLDEVMAPDFVGHSAGHGDFTLEMVRDSITREYADMPQDETIVEEQVAEGDRVITRWRYRWKHDRSVFGEQPTGTWLEMDGIHVDRIAGGKIAERWEIKDFMGVIRQLGGTVTFPEDKV
jgi:predicted ester cyclase